MHKPESVPENKTHKVLWDFEKQANHRILARSPDLVIIKKENLQNIGFSCPGGPQGENQIK